jgi:hypothetical protein
VRLFRRPGADRTRAVPLSPCQIVSPERPTPATAHGACGLTSLPPPPFGLRVSPATRRRERYLSGTKGCTTGGRSSPAGTDRSRPRILPTIMSGRWSDRVKSTAAKCGATAGVLETLLTAGAGRREGARFRNELPDSVERHDESLKVRTAAMDRTLPGGVIRGRGAEASRNSLRWPGGRKGKHRPHNRGRREARARPQFVALSAGAEPRNQAEPPRVIRGPA